MKGTNKIKCCIILSFFIILYIFICENTKDMKETQASSVTESSTTKEETVETTTEASLVTDKEQTEKEEKEIKQVEEKLEEYVDVWVTTNLNIRKEPDTKSKIKGVYSYGQKITVTYINDDWAKIKESQYYVSRKYLTEEEITYSTYDVPSNNSIKSYMDYGKITLKSSNQYKLQESAYTGNYGIRMVNGRYCIAVGSYYTTKIGTYLDVVLENGEVIRGILAECKADRDTDSTNRIHSDGSAIEFVVDEQSLNSTARKYGDVSKVNNWNSKVDYIKIYDKVEDF